ncbi:MAG: YqzL family protein [Clostridiales bacterium]|nr:YqzL family protein [Clostridiales bacterium]
MLQLLWNMFNETGEINSYMLYKAIEDSDQIEGLSDGAPKSCHSELIEESD